MDKIVIRGGNKLEGMVRISGSKNAALPIMAATLLSSGESIIENVPDLKDVSTMAHVLRILGAQVRPEDNRLTIDTRACRYWEAPYELVRTMRASVYVLGPLIARLGRARVSLPGGCAWGPRPVDFHLRGLTRLGADVRIEHGYIVAESQGLRGAEIVFEVPSVGATANLMMAATLAKGKTVMRNVALEPEITALAEYLNGMGARITGQGSPVIEVEGVSELRAGKGVVIPDRIEAGTYIIAGLVTGGHLHLENCSASHMGGMIDQLVEAGATIRAGESSIEVQGSGRLRSVDMTTAPFPGFPTDMQAQYMALMSLASGTSVITDEVFHDRFTHVPELRRLGADIEVEGNRATVRAVDHLSGAPVMASDLRASAALVLAGLVAERQTEILRVYHIDRGYERIEVKLRLLGADIERVRAEM
ncbi:MAG: UDP-N-acetylglucosamine 1-carboxyvinyltransferase [Candidatus Eisenbacteria sp.]|nr:UDP-N-acetylglucosamine 1-carboxyvinyltransferase [Candidatus Eisenbacteria bacterium]